MKRLILCLLIILSLTACNQDGSSSYAYETPTPIELLESNMQKWSDANIDSYEITVIFNGSFFIRWGYKIIVINNQIIEVTDLCFQDSNCRFFYEPSTFTIPGLFDLVGKNYNKPSEYSWNPSYLEITYSSEYGYPTKIRYNPPDVDDGGWCIAVDSFKIIE